MDSSISDILVAASEVQKNRLYFVTLKDDKKPRNTTNTYYFTIDDKLKYENFFNDNGPLNVSMLYHYCCMLNRLLNSETHATKKIIHYTTSADSSKRVNAALLIASFSIIYLNRTPDEAIKPLFGNNIPPYTKFSDASYGQSNNKITLENCAFGLYKALQVGFIRFDDFDSVQYEHYERVENGDLNWIVPNKFLAFCGPHTKSRIENGYPLHSPETYFTYFKQNHVTTVIRLNVKVYDALRFSKAGFHHNDLFFADGSTPNDSILKKFLYICETADGAIAVHCKAGLGRTGSLIGAYIIKHYGFTALEAIAWLRFCRPGSVIGCQQQWLEDKQSWLWAEGEQYYSKHNIDGQVKHKYGIYSMHKERLDNSLIIVAPNGATTVTSGSLSASLKNKVQNINNNYNMKDRLKGISDKVDTMKLSDECEIITSVTKMQLNNIINNNNIDATPTVTDYSNSTNNNNNLNNINNNTKSKLIQPIATRTSNLRTSRIIEQSQQTQGDKLNQIKALRRRHSRSVQQQSTQPTPAAVSSTTCIENLELNANKYLTEPQTHLHNHHTRSKSQPYRSLNVSSKLSPPSTPNPLPAKILESNYNNNNEELTADDDDNNNNNNSHLEIESDTDNLSAGDDEDTKRHFNGIENDNNGNNKNIIPSVALTNSATSKNSSTYKRHMNRIQMLNKRNDMLQTRKCETSTLKCNHQSPSSSSSSASTNTTTATATPSSTVSVVITSTINTAIPMKTASQETATSLMNNNYNFYINDRHNQYSNSQRARSLNIGITAATNNPTNTTKASTVATSPVNSTTTIMKKSIISCMDSNNPAIKYRRSLRRSSGNNSNKSLKHNGCIGRSGDINLDLNTMIVMTKSRGKRSLSSTRMEKEKTDEKSNKLLRKNMFNLSHGSPVVVAAATSASSATVSAAVSSAAATATAPSPNLVVSANIACKNLQKSLNHRINSVNNGNTIKKSSQTITPQSQHTNSNSPDLCEINKINDTNNNTHLIKSSTLRNKR